MNKKYLIPLMIFALTSCGSKTSEIKILAPTGAPSIAFYNYAQDSNFETNSVPKNILSFMNENSQKDVVVIDTVSGIQTIQKNNSFKIAATITFGNFFIASTGNDTNKIMDKDDTIILFGEGQTPDYIFHYLYGDKFNSNIEFVASAGDAAKCLITGINPITKNKVDYVFLAQPAIFNAMQKNKNASIYTNIQEEYKNKSGYEIIQASIYINNKVDRLAATRFLRIIKKDIEDELANPKLIEDKLNEISEEEQSSIFGTTGKISSQLTQEGNLLGLGYKSAIENKKAIDSFLKLFGIEETNEKIYFK